MSSCHQMSCSAANELACLANRRGVACLSRVNDGASGISLGKYVISTRRGRGGGPELETRSGGMGNRGTARERGPGTDHLPLAHNLLVYGRSVPCRVDLGSFRLTGWFGEVRSVHRIDCTALRCTLQHACLTLYALFGTSAHPGGSVISVVDADAGCLGCMNPPSTCQLQDGASSPSVSKPEIQRQTERTPGLLARQAARVAGPPTPTPSQP